MLTLIIFLKRNAAIPQWSSLNLPFCGPRFESLVQHVRFFNLYLNCDVKRMTKINKKEAGIGPYFNYNVYQFLHTNKGHVISYDMPPADGCPSDISST